GFSSVSGGANRYVPPAFRPGARGKGDQDGGEHSMAAAVKDATESSNTTRSLDRLARSPAGRGGGADDAFLSAVLFLLTAAVPTEATPSSGCKRRPSAALDSAEMSPSSAVPAAPAPAPTNGVGRDQQPQQQLSSPPPQPPSPPPLPSLSYPSASAAGQLSPPTSHPESTTGNNAGVTEWGNYRDCRRRQQPQPEGDSTSNDEGAHGDTGDDGDKREELLRSVAEAAKDTLGCECSCFLLQKGQDDKLTCDHA
ncbi:unnamed protein product, partial [Sphacelaria rigidula]